MIIIVINDKWLRHINLKKGSQIVEIFEIDIETEPTFELIIPLYSECKICLAKTKRLFNFIFLEPVPICNECANAIMLQQGKFLVENSKNG